MKVAYLVNQYPHITHTFIRREIRALEASGVEVVRISVRRSRDAGIDPDDRAEAVLTTFLLEQPFARWMNALVKAAIRSPLGFARAALWVLRAGPPHGERRGLMRSLAYLAEACLACEIVRERKADRLHAHFGTNSALVAALAHLISRVPFSFTVHGPEELMKAPRLALAKKVKLATAVAVISEYTRRELARWCDEEDVKKMHVIRCGVETARFSPPADAQVARETRFLCVARLASEKGIEVLIEAFARLADEGERFRLVLIGDGPLRAAIERTVALRELSSRIEILGWRDNVEVAREMTRARFVVCPSYAEGLPVALIEAMAGSRPVLASRIAGIPELVEPGRNGWLVEAGDVAGWESALSEAIHTPSWRWREMGASARETAFARHQADREAKRLAATCFGMAEAA